jgi:hypothetical protein
MPVIWAQEPPWGPHIPHPPLSLSAGSSGSFILILTQDMSQLHLTFFPPRYNKHVSITHTDTSHQPI